MEELRPNYITVIVRFNYDCNPYLKGAIKRSFLGKGKGAANIPEEMKVILDSDTEILNPRGTAYIRKPITTDLESKKKYKLSNRARALIIFYEYLGIYQKLNEFYKEFNIFLNKLFENDKDMKEKFSEDFYMKIFEQKTGKNAIWNGKITKQFLEWRKKPNKYSENCELYKIIVGRDLSELLE